MTSGPFTILQNLRDAAEARAQAITAQHPDWPCRRGCDSCCRSLARQPSLSQVEWQEVEAGLALLPAETRGEVNGRLAAASGSPAPHTCAFLDPTDGACLIYQHRPIACRTYGFHVDERGVGLYCQAIQQRVDGGDFTGVVWGNHSAVEARLTELGAPGPQT